MPAAQKHKDMISRAQRDAGGDFSVNEVAQVPQDQLWLVSRRGMLMARLTYSDWTQTAEIAESVAEAIEFVSRTKREPVCSLWINELPIDDFKLVLQFFEDEEPEEEPIDGVTEPAECDLPSNA